MEVCKKKLALAKRSAFLHKCTRATEKMLKLHKKRFSNPKELILHTSILYLHSAPLLRFIYYIRFTVPTFCPCATTRAQNTP